MHAFLDAVKTDPGKPEQDTTGHTFDFYTIRL